MVEVAAFFPSNCKFKLKLKWNFHLHLAVFRALEADISILDGRQVVQSS